MPSVLVIDDDASLRSVVVSTFERMGYRVYAAENGRSGVALFAAEPCDLVITEVLMPVMDGIETIIALRKIANPPAIIAISGAGYMHGADVLRTARLLGANAVLPKPVSMSCLLRVAAEVLDAKADAGKGGTAKGRVAA
jgi:CheY-like chemotaxis protein